MNCPRPRTGHGRNLSANVDWKRTVRVAASRCPSCRLSISRFTSESFRPMTSFDPAAVRQAVAEFTPLRPQKFQDLIPAKDVIVELRQKRASYRAIAELLTQHCLPTSKTAIATFCHLCWVKMSVRTDARDESAPHHPLSQMVGLLHPLNLHQPQFVRRRKCPQIPTALNLHKHATVARVSRRFGCSNLKPHETSRPHSQWQRRCR